MSHVAAAAISPLHVLHLRNVVAFGGPDTTLLGWCAHLDRAGFRASLASFENPGAPDAEFLRRLNALGVPTYSVPWGRRKRLVAAARRLVRLIREHRIDLLHTHDIRADVLGYLAARWAGIPVMTTVYVWFQSTSFTKVRHLERLDRVFLRRFDGLTAISEATRRQTIGYGFPSDGIETVYSGIDLAKFEGDTDRAAIRRSLNVGPADPLFVYVARLYPEKAHRVLIDAMADVVRSEPAARVALLGDGPCRPQLEDQVRALGLARHVIFAGIRDDVPQVLKACDFMVHPSLAEGIALGIQEGMAAGVPVIGTDVDGTPEVVKHEETGLLIPVNDVPALSAAMRRLLADRAMAARLGGNARALIVRHLSAPTVTRHLETVYRRVHGAYHAGRNGQAGKVRLKPDTT
jgi:glycosyltransferase involved in cell wall biosynthesis